MNVNATKDKLVSELSRNNKIKGIGQTGDINADLIPGNKQSCLEVNILFDK